VNPAAGFYVPNASALDCDGLGQRRRRPPPPLRNGPGFHAHRLADVTVAEVDRYREFKVREGALSVGGSTPRTSRIGRTTREVTRAGSRRLLRRRR